MSNKLNKELENRIIELDKEIRRQKNVEIDLLTTQDELKAIEEELRQGNSELVKTQLDLQSELTRSNFIQDHSPSGIVEFSYPEREIINLNDTLAKMLGYEKHELLGKGILGLLSQESFSVFNKEISNLIGYDKTISYDVELIKKTGEIIPVQIVSKGDTNLSSVIHSVIIDNTESKRIQKIILEKERLSAIGEIAAGVAHDFNNSLQTMFGCIDLAMLEQMPPLVKKYLEIIQNSARDAGARIRQLQRFSGTITNVSEYGRINLNDVVDDAILQTKNLWKDEAQKKGIVIDIDVKYDAHTNIVGDKGELRSVIYNLIKNSIQAMPQGGIIQFNTKHDGDKVYFIITDNGDGMDTHVKKRIFQPFFTTKSFEQGSGLGMSGAYSIIKEHNAQILVKHSAPNKGTSIEIIFPYDESLRHTTNVISELSNVARILWVDDEESIRVLGQKQLEKLGHIVEIASCGKDALDLLALNQYDLMITDIGMPNMNGWQLAKQVKDLYSDLKIAVVTGWGDNTSSDEKEKLGIECVLGKPFEMYQLKNLISEVLRSKKK